MSACDKQGAVEGVWGYGGRNSDLPEGEAVKRLRKYRCDACHQSLNKVPQAPMLHDQVWGRLVGPQEKILCAPCLFERANRLMDHPLGLADLLPCTFNLFGKPCWFDLFISLGQHEPTVLDQWRSVIFPHPRS
jgi:hypothetical protein